MAKNYPWVADDLVNAADLNDVVGVDTQTAGETITGSTTPEPVYFDSSDSEMYAGDASDISKLDIVAFAISDGTNGNDIDIQKDGVIGGFAGLTDGAEYFLQDGGGIGLSRGTYSILLGRAISTTELLIIGLPKSKDFNVSSISDNLKASADTERTVTIGTGKTLVKEIEIRAPGDIRVKWDKKVSVANQGSWSLEDEDGNVLATEITISTSYLTVSHDIRLRNITKLQLYATNGASSDALTRNFRIYYDLLPLGEITVNTD
jgi:hypothetical protein